jgi:hypothetical protein
MKSMKAILVLFLFVICFNATGQNLIGYHEKDIRIFMKEKQKNMTFQSFTNNSTFKYLKYCNQDETQTLLFFLTSDSVCKSERLVCDKSLKSQKIREMDSAYKKSGENTWTETKNNKKYLIELKEEAYTFNITIRLND